MLIYTKSIVFMMNPLPSISKASSLLLQEETHKQFGGFKTQLSTERKTFSANKYPDNKIYFNRQSENNSGVGNSQRSFEKTNLSFERALQNENHTIDKCWKLDAYPKDSRGRRKRVDASTETQGNMLDSTEESGLIQFMQHLMQYKYANQATIVVLGKNIRMLIMNKQLQVKFGLDVSSQLVGQFCLLSNYHNNYILDSGTTNHMCFDLSTLDSYDPFINLIL